MEWEVHYSMPFNTALARNIDTMGTPTKKQKLEANTPLKHFLRPIMEEAMMKRMQMMQQEAASQQMQQMPQQAPTSNPLQGALQGGLNGGLNQSTPTY